MIPAYNCFLINCVFCYVFVIYFVQLLIFYRIRSCLILLFLFIYKVLFNYLIGVKSDVNYFHLKIAMDFKLIYKFIQNLQISSRIHSNWVAINHKFLVVSKSSFTKILNFDRVWIWIIIKLFKLMVVISE